MAGVPINIKCGRWIAIAPSPARHGGCKKEATAAPLALSRTKRARDLQKEAALVCNQRSRDLGKGSGRESRCPSPMRARDLQKGVDQGKSLYYQALC